MAAPITDQSYTQQINQAFDFLKTATPQQMQAVGQQVAGNPQSPEAMALAMAAQYQQQTRAAQQPPAPQGTVLQQKLAEFQQQAGPAQGGIPAVGTNQMAMQQAAQQDPMRNAGIAAAPENMEQAPQAPQGQMPQGVATGGLTALAHGGEVRHFNGAEQPSGLAALRKQAYAESIAADKQDEGAEHIPAGQSTLLQNPRKKDYNTSQFEDTANSLIGTETPKVETSFAKAIANSPSAKEQIKSIADLLGKEPDMTEEVDMAKQYAADARRDKMLGTMTQGIGGMLSAQTPYIGQALGAGLTAGAKGYTEGAASETAANKDLMALQMAHTKALTSGDKDAAKLYLTDMMAQNTAVEAARAKGAEMRFSRETDLMKGIQTGQFGLAKEQLQGQLALNLEQFKAKNSQLLEQVKSDIESGGLKPQHQKDIFNALINSGVGSDEAQTLIPGIIKTLTATSAKAPTSSFSGLGPNAQPLQGGLFRTPPPAH